MVLIVLSDTQIYCGLTHTRNIFTNIPSHPQKLLKLDNSVTNKSFIII